MVNLKYFAFHHKTSFNKYELVQDSSKPVLSNESLNSESILSQIFLQPLLANGTVGNKIQLLNH